MARIFLIASGAILLTAASALATDYQVATVIDDGASYELAAADYALPLTVDYHALVAGFAPAFHSNFCELVRFPELGSHSVCDGFTAVARGPPRRQFNHSQLNTKREELPGRL